MTIDGNPLRRLQQLGQSVWVNMQSLDLLASGTLRRLIEDDGVSGVISALPLEITSETPAMARGAGMQRQALADAIEMADLLAPVYRGSGGSNGFISLELASYQTSSPEAIVEGARALWAAANRQNIMVKVPASKAGLPAIRRLIADGINVNACMIFSVDRYWDVAEAYLSGLEARQCAGEAIGQVNSVASFSLARIDAYLDHRISYISQGAASRNARAVSLAGKAAIASAKMAYRDFRLDMQRRRFQELARKDAQPQRLLWDTAGAANAEAAIRYVEPLIGPDTICALSPDTFEAYRMLGHPMPMLNKGFAEADGVLADLSEMGINVSNIAHALEVETMYSAFTTSDGRNPDPAPVLQLRR